ncbi:MAG: helix-turn-helix domain-containing protein [Phycisphaerales bacterium]|jgi:excisionase family DNA binding protein
MGNRQVHDRWAGKEIFSTGEAAEVCGVSQQTIIRCFDSGRLRGFRVPGSRFRRIPRNELVRFMRENGIPLTSLSGGSRRVLLLSSDAGFADAFTRASSGDARLEVRVATTAFEGGVMTEQFAPHLLVVDADLPQFDARAVLRRAQGKAESADARVVIIGAALHGDRVASFVDAGAALCMQKPVDVPALLARIGELAA